MTTSPFDTPITEHGAELVGPLRAPRQMLATQQYDNHTSIHDDATAQKLGFKGGTIEGPTHFSQFVPLCVAVWGPDWLAAGCLSVHYRNPCFEGEQVRAFITRPAPGATLTAIRMERSDGTEILRGSASIGEDHGPTALEQRIATLEKPERLVILRDVHVGMKSRRIPVRMEAQQHMGALYPFSLADKLRVITENSPWYSDVGATTSPWQRPIIPIEMISVLCGYAKDADPLPVRGPVVGLFADQEIRVIRGPLLVGEDYEIEREVIALSGSRRTESMWIKTRIYRPGTTELLATMLLNSASLKDSYANYAAEAAAVN
jgi:hypothetical protein